MRIPLLLLAFSMTASVASAQTLAFTFSSTPLGPSDPGQAIASRTALRAWQDSVEVFAQQIVQRQTGWRVVIGAAGDAYAVSVALVPVAKPGYSAVAMSVAIQEPKRGLLSGWNFLTHYVAVVESAQAGAVTLVETTIAAIRNAHH